VSCMPPKMDAVRVTSFLNMAAIADALWLLVFVAAVFLLWWHSPARSDPPTEESRQKKQQKERKGGEKEGGQASKPVKKPTLVHRDNANLVLKGPAPWVRGFKSRAPEWFSDFGNETNHIAAVSPYRETPVFDRESVPKGLLRDHSTRSGVWALARVESGALVFHVGPDPGTHWGRLSGVGTPEEAFSAEISAGEAAVIAPEALHRVDVAASGADMRFLVQFWQSEHGKAAEATLAELSSGISAKKDE
jgi:tellurite resistance-related uncharacterized protein